MVVESITAHAEKGAGTKTTLYVGQEEEDDVEKEAEDVGEVGGGRGKDKPHHPLMISVQKVRIRPGKGKGSMYWGGGDKVCFEGEVMGLRVLHGWGG